MNGDVQVFCKMWRMSLCLLLIVYLLWNTLLLSSRTVDMGNSCRAPQLLKTPSLRSFYTSEDPNPVSPRRIPEQPFPQRVLT